MGSPLPSYHGRPQSATHYPPLPPLPSAQNPFATYRTFTRPPYGTYGYHAFPTQHQTLPATPAAAIGGPPHGGMVGGHGGGAVVGGGPVATGPPAPGGYPPRMPGVERVVEYLDVVKNEFEGLQGDCVILKGQRDEFEAKSETV